MRCPEASESGADALPECLDLCGVDRLHRALELALVRLERVQFCVDVVGDILCVVGFVGLPQQQQVGAMVGQSVLLEEVRITGGDDALARQQAGMPVVRVQAVALPRVVTQHHAGGAAFG